jgi:hypothetical protein
MWRHASICALALLTGGCQGSRWARDDVDYARKYPRHTGNVLKMTKQAIDARHVEGKHGLYGGAAASRDPIGAAMEGGVFGFPSAWSEVRLGLAGLAHDGDNELSAGLIAGARVQLPTRLAPYAGAQIYAGLSDTLDAEGDGVDNDDDFFIDEPGEEIGSDLILAVAPELGVHYWLTSQWRLSGGVDYRLTSDVAAEEGLYYGISLAWLAPGQSMPAPPRKAKLQDGVWSFEDQPGVPVPTTLPNFRPEISRDESEVLPAIRLEDALEATAPDEGVRPVSAYEALPI